MAHRSTHAISQATAGRLLADSHISPVFLSSTIYNEDCTDTVVILTALHDVEDARLAALVAKHRGVYLIKCALQGKFEHYYYIVTEHIGTMTCWYCNTTDCKHVRHLMSFLKARYEQQKEQEAVLIASFPAVTGVTEPDIAVARIIRLHPHWFVPANRLIAQHTQATQEAMQAAIRSVVDVLRQQAVSLTTETIEEVA